MRKPLDKIAALRDCITAHIVSLLFCQMIFFAAVRPVGAGNRFANRNVMAYNVGN